MLRKWDIIDEQARRQCLDEVIARIDEHEGSQFGLIAAQEVIDIVAKYLGPQAYNTALKDSKKIVETKLIDIDVDIDLLRVNQ